MAYTTIDDGSKYFQIAEWAGNDTARSITFDGNSDMQPDWMWFKNHTELNRDHQLQDSSRGVTKTLQSNGDSGESTLSNLITSFDSDGFSIGNNALVNEGAATIIGWGWKINGGTTASNDDGNLTTTIQVNQTAGISIVLWTSTSTTDTIGHGLGATPLVIIEKSRELDDNSWMVFNSMGGNRLLFLDTTAGETTSFSGVSSVGSSVFTDGNGGTDTRVAWCFTPIQGYSKFGIYTGNGAESGPVIYTGFKPAFLLKKGTGTGDWHISDSTQGTNDNTGNSLRPNEPNITETGNQIDFLSNGFKIRNTGGSWNGNGNKYIYMAFAEHPFVSSKGVPVTAR